MYIKPIKTHKIISSDQTITSLLDQYLPVPFPERAVIAVTSKIVSICEGRVVKVTGDESQKDTLIEQEAQWYLSRFENPYNVSLTITNDLLTPSAGIDESNGNGSYILWPKNPQESANKIREHIVKNKGVREVGVILTDSKTTPLRWGVTGIAIAHSGFQAINDYIGKDDLFGRKFAYEKVNVMDSLAASAVFAMGEGSEQLPLALLIDVPNVIFQERNPTEEELKTIRISKEEDIYSPFLISVPWKKGGK
jgi:putative folate metabolism gamma-glutamate ligase